MSGSIRIITTLKAQLKRAGITYRDLAKALGLSESAIKQMFSSNNCSLRRLEEICDIISLDVAELVALSARNEKSTVELSEAWEQALVTDKKLLVVAYCLTNDWTVNEIFDRYALEETELIQILAKLDKMKLIELLPGNRVRLRIANNFSWIPDGPIENFFQTEVQSEFFSGRFHPPQAIRFIKNGDITEHSKRRLMEKMEQVAGLFDDTCVEDKKAAMEDRRGTTMILALRNWQFKAFVELERRHLGDR